MRLTYSHKYIENTTTCRITHTENLWKADKRLQDYDAARKAGQNNIGQKKRRRGKEGKGNKMGPALPGGRWEEEQLLHPGSFPHRRRDQLKVEEELEGNGAKQFKKETSLHKCSGLWAMSNCQQVLAGVGN